MPANRSIRLDKSGCEAQNCDPVILFAKLGKEIPYIRIGDYHLNTQITFQAQDASPNIHVVGATADYSPESPIIHIQNAPVTRISGGGLAAFVVASGAHITVEGVFFAGAQSAIHCQASTDGSSVRFLRSAVTGAKLGVVAENKCQVNVDRVWFGSLPLGRIWDGGSGPIETAAIQIDRARVDVFNSIISASGSKTGCGGINILENDADSPIRLINTTFAKMITTFCSDQIISCKKPMSKITMANTLLFDEAESANGTMINPLCDQTMLYRVASNDVAVTGQGTMSDLKPSDVFVNYSSNNYAIKDDAHIFVRNGGLIELLDINGYNLIPKIDLSGKPRSPTQTTLGAMEAKH